MSKCTANGDEENEADMEDLLDQVVREGTGQVIGSREACRMEGEAKHPPSNPGPGGAQ